MRFSGITTVAAALTIMAASLPAGAADGDTVKAIKDRGHLICGADGTRPGFSAPDSQGKWSGFDVDFCRAVAAAILGEADKVKYIALTPVQRFPSLQSGEIDMLSRVTTWTLTRDTALGFNFAPVTLYAGTKLMVHKSLGVKSGKELNGASVCVPPGTTIERNIADFFGNLKMSYTPVVIDNLKELNDAYLAKRCDVMANFGPGLALVRLQSGKQEDHVILPDDLVKEPLGPAIRHGDEQFHDIVTWTVLATFQAEEWGISSKNVDEMRDGKNPEIERFLGKSGDLGKKLGIAPDWVYQIVKQVGNYEEIFENNIGKNAPLKMERGLNRQWTQGGLLYAPPFQ
jgi:general L-amino acid transport system substrate-binding protein